ncbi:curli biogenesis system outer membrane secretion channel CsgG [Novosphingobium hassiacum]|uniref:Curli biogenesis system outer membrane secretion channel CsgG n=1 Tax=Novosphingobium hassiacum TaxID=173676 RepID=A0A7W6A383_9SPHN|nr:CsgG/HfaB family protein [Novosphingobium hassiacum]MBB3862455.1 curli biogenesis system outer membrane secretion channel CsgG [Novosphingobium hassiacum]
MPLLALALPGCASMTQQRIGIGEEPIIVGPPVRDNRTPMDGALACYAGWLASRGARPLVIAVGDVRDYTGKYSVNEGNAITQGGALMVASALGKLRGSVRIAERFDPVIAERELAYADRRQLGDGKVHDLASPAGRQIVPWLPYFGGSIAASDYYIVGGITELNYDIRSGGVETGVTSVGPKARTYTQSVALDLRIVDTRSLLVVRTVSLTKQFTGYETGFGVFRFFGSNLFDINIGAKGQEPLQLGIRTALEEATMRLIGAVARVDPDPCMSQASWAASVPPAPDASLVSVAPSLRQRLAANGLALNGPASASADSGAVDVSILFETGMDGLQGGAEAAIDRIVTGARRGGVFVTLLAHDTEALDPKARAMLTDRRIAALMAALAKQGVAAASIHQLWRPDPTDPTDPAVQRGSAGLQRLARLRIG